MAGYFSYFPKTLYTFDKNTVNQQIVTNILLRSSFLKEVSNNSAVFYEYIAKETDTPEIIADKLYGDPNRHWIVLLFNKISNPYYEFPMTIDALESYITNKYNQTLSQSQSTIHHYELEVTRKNSVAGRVVETSVFTYTINDKEVDFTTGEITERTVPGTADTSIDLVDEQVVLPDGSVVSETKKIKAVSNYTYEFLLNESRRTIKLLDSQYISKIENEFRQLMNE